MKFVKILFLFVFLFLISSCVDIDEEVNIDNNGSGEWSLNMDMSKLLELMQNYIGKDELDKQIPQGKMDTSMTMKNFVDSSAGISEEKKALLSQGRLHMNLNMEDKMFKTDMHFPFQNMTQLQEIYTSLGDGSLGTNQFLKNMSQGNSGTDSMHQQGPDLGQINSLYHFTSKNGFLSRTVNQERFNALKENPQYAQLKQAGDMGMEVPYTVNIHLPRPVKKVTNTFAQVSPDKRTITIKYNLIEALDHPERFEYTIEY